MGQNSIILTQTDHEPSFAGPRTEILASNSEGNLDREIPPANRSLSNTTVSVTGLI